jgi:hypothetical protein
MGRPSLFPGAKTERVQAMITKLGKRRFEAARLRLALRTQLAVSQVSTAAVVEYLAHDELPDADFVGGRFVTRQT